MYQEALAIEFAKREILYRREVAFPVFYKEIQLKTPYRPGFICDDGLVVELKALARVGGIEEAQVINYLKVSGYEVGVLLNFGARSLDYRRFVFSKSQSVQSA